MLFITSLKIKTVNMMIYLLFLISVIDIIAAKIQI